MELNEIKIEDFDGVYAEMEKNFIFSERRDYTDQKKILNNEKYKIYHLINEKENIGFITIWDLCGFYFVEHFVVYEKFRNNGYGATALSLLTEKFKNVVLECETENFSQMAKRRYCFYQRNGFKDYQINYFQPPYRKGGEKVKLALMSYPKAIENIDGVVKEIYAKVYEYENM